MASGQEFEEIAKESFNIDGKSKLSSIASRQGEFLVVDLKADGPNLVLHWGVSAKNRNEWLLPPADVRPEGSTIVGSACQTPLKANGSSYELQLKFPESSAPLGIVFVVKRDNQWLKNQGANYFVRIVPPKKSLLLAAREQKKAAGIEPLVSYVLDDDIGLFDAYFTKNAGAVSIELLTDAPDIIWHWGVALKKKNDWVLPPQAFWPASTKKFDDKAAQTPFTAGADGISKIEISIPEDAGVLGLPFVLTQTGTGRWLKNRGGNFFVQVKEQPRPAGVPRGIDPDTADAIIEAEVNYSSWTLMHRYNMCHDFLDAAAGSPEKMALLAVWLRYSFIRQLDWQRSYNTKPRELAASQDRLTMKLTDLWKNNQINREAARMMLATLGKGGGNGQRIRDEILHIMHRNHIPERAGTFMEEWHQKLHNNTTPDDVVICEAFLEFLHRDGNQDAFYSKLKEGGVTRERLASFERSIRSSPEFWGHMKGALIHEFQEYLKILKSVHSGTDMDTVAQQVRYALDGGQNNLLNAIMHGRGDWNKEAQIARITEFRRNLKSQMDHEGGGKLRDLMFIDLSVEESLRLVVEGLHLNPDDLAAQVRIVAFVLENVSITCDRPDFWDTLKELQRLKDTDYNNRDGYLHLKAIMDRIRRIIGSLIDKYQNLYQTAATFLGTGFGLESWVVLTFTEELIRGSALFNLSTLLGKLDPVLRKKADMGNWQIISPGAGSGTLVIVDALIDVQDEVYEEPTVLLAVKITGEEEVPDNVWAVVTSDQPDILSHCAVRARNQHVLFATCYSAEEFEAIKKLAGKTVTFVDAGGSVVYEEGAKAAQQNSHVAANTTRKTISQPKFSNYAIAASQFNKSVVGGKSNNLTGLRGKLPEWIHYPASAALPFGTCEQVLADPINAAVKKQYDELVPKIDSNHVEILHKLKDVIMTLQPPQKLIDELAKAMAEEKMTLEGSCTWDEAWKAIKGVWASKFNDRAYVSCKKVGIEPWEVSMAVLVQEVVPAQYAYVIHTTNPFTKAEDELYAEIVVGLGETLVGAYPGRALGFTVKKSNPKEPRILGFPNKSEALYGGGLIFRSDSNGEDLEGYAGAGLYDSILAKPAKEIEVAYANEPLVWDGKFRYDMMVAVAQIGLTIEQVLSSPQDIEGAFTNGKYYVVQTRPQV